MGTKHGSKSHLSIILSVQYNYVHIYCTYSKLPSQWDGSFGVKFEHHKQMQKLIDFGRHSQFNIHFTSGPMSHTVCGRQTCVNRCSNIYTLETKFIACNFKTYTPKIKRLYTCIYPDKHFLCKILNMCFLGWSIGLVEK